MQEVTDGAFWTLVHKYGGADVYWTEYFRVHSTSTPEKKILEAINRNTRSRQARFMARRYSRRLVPISDFEKERPGPVRSADC